MKLIQFLSSRFIIISLFFSSATWAQPIFFKTDVDNPVSVPFFIDDEDTEAVDKPNYPLALIAPNIQNSNAWLTSEAIATVCVGALIIGSLGLAFKYRAVIHRTIFNGLRPAAIVVEQAVEQLTDNSVIDTSSETMPETEAVAAPEILARLTMNRAVEIVVEQAVEMVVEQAVEMVVEQAVEQLTDNSVLDTSSETMPETEAVAAPEILARLTMNRAVEMVVEQAVEMVVEQAVEQLTDNSVIDTSSETMPETEAAAAPEIFASITMDRAVEMVQDSLLNKRIQRRDDIVRGIINSISRTKYSRATASKDFASQIPKIQQTIIKDIVFLIDNGQFYMM